MKRVTVTFALPERQWSWQLTLPDAATVGEALAQARHAAGDVPVPWQGPVGIFGVLCDRSAVPAHGDRIEIYRELIADPKVSRRERVRAARQARDQAASRPRSGSRS
jgi:putative ubiquitin-RnfH superfamily antitoxin RatB of RatAB toxin-antitoxin module